MEPLLVSAALAVAGAAGLGYVGSLIARRPLPRETRIAGRAFSVWWFGLGAFLAVTGLREALAAVGLVDLGFHLGVEVARNAVLAVGFGSLIFYLLFIYTGSRRILGAVVAYYVAALLFVEWTILSPPPVGVDASGWTVLLVYEMPPPSWLAILNDALIIGPMVLAALAYMGLLFAAPDATSRYRIAVVSGTFVGAGVLYGVVLVAFGDGNPFFVLGWRLIVIAGSLLIVAAYQPPRWVQRRLGVEAVAHSDVSA